MNLRVFCRIVVLLSILVVAVACNEADKARVEELRQDLDELQGRVLPGVPDAADVVPEQESGFAISFDKVRYGVDAGGSVTINYTLPEAAELEFSVPQGWGVEAGGSGASSGAIVVTAPDPASPAEIIVTATTSDDRATAAMLPLMVRDPYTSTTRTTFMTMGYRGPKNHMATLETFQKLADAGLKLITVETDEGPFMHQLDLAEQVGMKCVPVVWDAAERYERDPGNYKGLDELIGKLRDHPATYAYHIYDEPSTNLIPALKLRKERIEALDPNHPVYINLLSEASPAGLGVQEYYDYIETYIRECDVKLLSFDIYPCRPPEDPTYCDQIIPYWWKCNEIVSSLTKRYGIPWWAFAASCWIDKEQHLFAKPTLENLRLQVYTNLAYGAQVIQYFVILQYGGTDYAPLMIDGTWTAAYDTLKEFNTELHRRGWVFDGCEMEKVRHTNLLPTWSERLSEADLPPQIRSLSTDQDALIGFISNRGNKYVTIANKSLKDKMTVDAVFGDMVYTIARDGIFTERQTGPAQFLLDESDMLVIKYQ